MKQEALRYLSDIYSGASYIRTLDPTPLLDTKKLRFDNVAQGRFKMVVKSFLLNTGMKFTHSTASGYDIVQAYLTNTDEMLFDRAKAVDLLILYLVSDPKNGHYGNILTSLIEARDLRNKHTWLFSLTTPDSPSFRSTYQPEFADYVGKQFTAIRG
ncbi:hypothetical protein [Bradyrhizobium japonicum]|uniref:hypothetical protein n=1 Tax=Bradyrhizobium japonicum TaxID=375 RepID=UPI000576CC38|nr:hypothetical protein [Bradyrhizobium japonicum]